MFKGYKTFIIAALTVILGVVGKHVAPQVIADYADVIIAGLGLTFAGLRIATTSPVFRQIEQEIATEIGLSSDAKAAIMQAASDLGSSVSRLTGHPIYSPATADVLSQLSESIPAILSALTPPSAQTVTPAVQAVSATGDEALRTIPAPQPTSNPVAIPPDTL